MNELVTRQQERGLAISEDTKALSVSGVSENTLVAYRRATRSLETWLSGRVLSDGLLVQYITEFHIEGKSPATIAQVVAAANRCIRCRYANGWQVEVLGHAGTLCEDGAGGTGHDRTVQVWEEWVNRFITLKSNLS